MTCLCQCAACSTHLDDSQHAPPTATIDLGNGYILLNKSDKHLVCPSHNTATAIVEFLSYPEPVPKIRRWARLLLRNGQIAWSVWKEELRSADKLRISRMIKVNNRHLVLHSTERLQFKMDDTILFGEVIYFTRLVIGDAEDMGFANVALGCMFSHPDTAILHASYSTVPRCEATDTIRIVEIHSILSVVGMIPMHNRPGFFVIEKPGLSVSHFIAGEEAINDNDVN